LDREDPGDFQLLADLEVAFAAKPFLHGSLQPIERNTRPGLKNTITGGECVVKDRIVREIAHGKVVNPVDGAGMALTGCVDTLDGKAAGEHDFNVNEPWGEEFTVRSDFSSTCVLPQRINSLEAARGAAGIT